jgi:hypothetical protein
MEEGSNETRSSFSLKEFFKSKRFLKIFFGVLIGSLSGFAYFYFIGCNSGTCAITSNPYNSIMAGGILGLIISA